LPRLEEGDRLLHTLCGRRGRDADRQPRDKPSWRENDEVSDGRRGGGLDRCTPGPRCGQWNNAV